MTPAFEGKRAAIPQGTYTFKDIYYIAYKYNTIYIFDIVVFAVALMLMVTKRTVGRSRNLCLQNSHKQF